MSRYARCYRFVLLAGFCALPAFAVISFRPEPIEDRFAKADFVCRCTVSSIRQTNEKFASTGKLQPADFEILLMGNRIYKGAITKEPRVLALLNIDPSGGPPLRQSQSYLFFLNQSTPNHYRIIESPGAISSFMLPSEKINDPRDGLQALQADIRDSVILAQNDRAIRQQLQLLSQFGHLDSSSLELLEHLSNSPIVDTSVISLSMLARSTPNPQLYISRLVPLLLTYHATYPPNFEEIGSLIASSATIQNLNDLERLSHSDIPSMQLLAMQGIRKIGSPLALQFLIQQLAVKDPNIQYSAVITLAEITRKFGEFAPDNGSFSQNPDKYVRLWKDWAANETGPSPKSQSIPK